MATPGGDATMARVKNRRQWIVPAVLAIYGVLLIICADTRIEPGLDSDRYALMESLVERGTVTVDDASLVSVDRIRIGGHFYSGKPPLLTYAGAGVYWILHTLPGWSFRTHPQAVVRVMIAVFVVVPVCALLWMFWGLCSRRLLEAGDACLTNEGAMKGPGVSAWAGLGLLALASLLLPYSLIFTNHPLAAALLFGAFCVALAERRTAGGAEPGPAAPEPILPRGSRSFLVALLAGLSAAVDLLPGAVFLLAYLGTELAGRRWRSLAAGIAGAAVPFCIHIVLNMLTLRTWMLSYLVRDAFRYEGSVWDPGFTGRSDYDQFPTYPNALYHYALGHRGVFVFMPLLVMGAWWALKAVRKPRAVWSSAGLAAVAALGGTILLVPVFSMGLGGGTYGPRHVIPCLGLLYVFLVPAMRALRSTVRRAAFAAVAAWSLLIAALGVLDPWAPQVYSVYAPLDVVVPRIAFLGEEGRDVAEWIIDHTAVSPSFAYYNLGRRYAAEGELERAIHYLTTSLSLDSTRTLALYQLGITAGRAGYRDISVDAFQRLLKLEPENSGAWANLGVTLLADGRRQEARLAFEKGLSLNPTSRAALGGLARLYAEEGDEQKAKEYMDRIPK